jgi:hypothetical protein
MSFVRSPVLKPALRKKLKEKLTPLWQRPDMTAPMIAKELKFGLSGTDFQKLKMYHVYFYRAKFGLPPRRERIKGFSRYKNKQEELMSYETFCEVLDKKLDRKTFHHRRQRSYLILHYWTPLRKSEIYERVISDFEIKSDLLTIHLLRKKKKYSRNVTDEPINVPLAFPKMDEVIEWLQKKEWKKNNNPLNRPWNISHQTAWRYVNQIFPGYYPHFFRFNYITEEANDPETSLAELRAKTGLHIVTLNSYLMKSERLQEAIDRRRLKRISPSSSLL